jgi:hypothetical protein
VCQRSAWPRTHSVERMHILSLMPLSGRPESSGREDTAAFLAALQAAGSAPQDARQKLTNGAFE